VFWSGVDPLCRVECGGWQTAQGNEYLGSHPRLCITPLTTRLFVFMSSSLRENSAVLYKCGKGQPMAGELFREFANTCAIGYREYTCTPDMGMGALIQYLTGGAFSRIWLGFEFIDLLPYTLLTVFNKEVQLMQQQFIISDME